jgi:octaprenyl-diphosphate synthase
MTRLVEDQSSAANYLRTLYAPIQDELDQADAMLREDFSSSDAFVDRLARHGFRLGGKRLRPALVLLTARLCGPIVREHLTLAAVMEMIHTATLLHDDVLDEATLRRHIDTVNARWSNEASILLGDYMLARAIEKVGTLDSPFACEAIGRAAKTVCEGELRQVQWRGKFDLDEATYLEIIADKTAALTACCCRLGAHYAAAHGELEDRMARFGQLLGIAFQIADDLLDLMGDEATAGKSLGTDLAKQKATLPLIRLLGQVQDAAKRGELLAILTRSDNHRGSALGAWFQESDAIAYAQDKAVQYARWASALLDDLPASPARDSLQALTEFAVQRRS